MLSGAISLFLTGAIAIFVILLVIFAHTVSRWVKISFAGVLINLLLWQATIYVADNTTQHLLFWNHLVFLWPTLAVLSFFLFVTLLRPDAAKAPAKEESRRKYIGATTVGIALILQVVAIASGRIFSDVSYTAATNEYVFVRDVFYPIYLAGLVIMLITGFTRLIINFFISKKKTQERQAFRTILITVAIAMTYGVTTNVVLPLITGSQEYIVLGLVTIDIFTIGFGLSIIRHQFLDIKAYVLRAVVYLIAALVVAGLYVVGASLLSTHLLGITLNNGSLLLLSLITLGVALSFNPLKVRFDHLTNRLFFRDYYSPQDVLDELGGVLVGTVDVDEIRTQSGQLLEAALRPAFVRFMLVTDQNRSDRQLLNELILSGQSTILPYDIDPTRHDALTRLLKKEDVALAVRLRTKHGDLGFVMLGFRQSGAGYTYGDRRFMSVVADQLAVALQNALRFQEINDFNKTLQQKINDATKQLRRTNDKLRQLDQTKDDFISMASHQLRTPLTSVKGYVSMVLDGDAGDITPLQRKLLNQSFVSSQRMVYLISDLLNVSRLRTGKFLIEPTRSSLADVIRDEVAQLQETAKGRNLTLNYQRPEHFPVLMLDETKMRQVIMNFMDNAIYYTPSGGEITINLVERPTTIEFTVVDNGIGVPKHEQFHLFSKFYRAHNAKRARPDGTGLGLFMAKKVIVAQGGAIIFKSKEKVGSTFGFTFAKAPLLPENQPAAGPVTALTK